MSDKDSYTINTPRDKSSISIWTSKVFEQLSSIGALDLMAHQQTALLFSVLDF
ncbi:hypothetical protein AAZX31_08G058100 [Glycine max]